MRPMSLILVPVLLLATPSIGIAAGQTDEANSQITVSFHDLNLQREGDAKSLLRRIQHAALVACGASDESIPEYRRLTIRSKCYSNAVSSAVYKINSPILTAIYTNTRPTELARR